MPDLGLRCIKNRLKLALLSSLLAKKLDSVGLKGVQMASSMAKVYAIHVQLYDKGVHNLCNWMPNIGQNIGQPAYLRPTLAISVQPWAYHGPITSNPKALQSSTAPIWDMVCLGIDIGLPTLGPFKVGMILVYIWVWHACRLQILDQTFYAIFVPHLASSSRQWARAFIWHVVCIKKNKLAMFMPEFTRDLAYCR